MVLKLFAPQSPVQIGNRNSTVDAVVLSVRIEPRLNCLYCVAWWDDDGTRTVEWLDGSEIFETDETRWMTVEAG